MINEYRSRAEQLLSILEKLDVLVNLRNDRTYPDLPHLLQVSCDLKYNPTLSDGGTVSLSGHGYSTLSAEHALLKALAEAGERVSQISYREKNLIFASYDELVGDNSLHVVVLDPSEYDAPGNERTRPRGWVRGTTLLGKKPCLIPAQLVYYNYAPRGEEPYLLDPNTTGAAAGFDRNFAVSQCLFELLERDAFISVFLTKSSPPRVDLRAVESSRLRRLEYLANRYSIELHVLHLTNNLSVPCFAAFSVDRSGLGPAFNVGLKSSFVVEDAIVGALEESFMIRSAYRAVLTERKGVLPTLPAAKIRTLEERGMYWMPLEKLSRLDFLLDQPYKPLSINSQSYSDAENLASLTAALRNHGIEVYLADVSLQEFKEIGFVTYKAIAPKLQFLHLTEARRTLQPERLQQVAAYFGKPTFALNSDPQPFL